MSWINLYNYLFVALVLSSLTGTSFFLVWMVLNKTVLSGDCILSEKLLRFTMHTFWVPVLFVVLLVRYQDGLNPFAFGNGERRVFRYCMLEMSPTIMHGIIIITGIWIVGVIGMSIHWLRQYIDLSRILKGSVPETDSYVLKRYEQARHIVGIEKEVLLVRNDLIMTPFSTGVRHQRVVLPFRKYTDAELDTILVHELFHCKQKDLKWKMASFLISLFHAWNPFTHLMRRNLSEMAECVCDNLVCTSCRENFNTRAYFSIILSEITEDYVSEDYFCAGLKKSTSELQRRVTSMRNYQTKGVLKKSLAALTVSVFMIGSSMTAYAAGNGVIDAHHTWYEETRVEESIHTESATIYTVLPENVVEVPTTVMATALTRTTNTIDWSVPAGSKYVTGEFSMSAGDTMNVSAKSTPSGKTVRIGIQYQDGTQYYMNCSGSALGSFSIGRSGKYRFYVENVSDTEVRVEAAYVR